MTTRALWTCGVVATLAPRRLSVEVIFAAGDASTPQLFGVVPTEARIPYDVREVMHGSPTAAGSRSSRALYGPTLVTGFARLHGHPVGCGEQRHPVQVRAEIHFIQPAPARIPLVFLQNISGFMVGRDYEAGGIAKHGAKMVTAVSCARVPKLTVIIGGSFGAGNYSMAGRAYSPRFLWMWPNARISVMGGEQAASVLATVRREQAEARGEQWPADAEERFKQPIREQYERQGNPYYSTARLWDDGVIDPADTRTVLGLALSACANAPLEPAGYGVFRISNPLGIGSQALQTGGEVFDTVLVANRGEIAVRVIRTLRRLGIRSVAVYSDADAGARHVRDADAAFRLGPAAPRSSYLDIGRIVDACRQTGAQAVHPGYGFLAENAEFARACERPASSSSALSGRDQAMGDKIRAKQASGGRRPVVPGRHEPGLGDAELAAAATDLGFPVLIKPSAAAVVRGCGSSPDRRLPGLRARPARRGGVRRRRAADRALRPAAAAHRDQVWPTPTVPSSTSASGNAASSGATRRSSRRRRRCC
jgi:hypothetical protein